MAAPIFPVRVIDVEKTLLSHRGSILFSRPTNWEFHTISHRWSRVVESWSAVIKDICGSSAGKLSYDDLIQRENFKDHEFFPPFVEFLGLLRADGVKHVWLDSLCINQASDSGEKTRELQNMGSYYAKSLGCYVCVHGFGEGFQTWKVEETRLVMPSWFNRVWTFQEMLLPQRLTFILEIHPIIGRTINWNISKREADGITGPCRCVMSMNRLPHPRNLIDDGAEEEKEVSIICGGSLCSQCGAACLIRGARDPQLLAGATTATLYFVEKECIVRLMIMAKEQLQKTVGKMADEDDELKLLRLEAVMQNEEWDPIQIVVEVSRRHCSIAEDRVLSVLGLLGVEGRVQFSSGKTLDAQLLHLAQQLSHVNPTTLVKLCIAQFAGHSTPGMSWAPSLEGLRPTGEKAPDLTWEEFHHDEHKYARQMKVEEGSEAGLLQLAQVMKHFAKTLEVEAVLDDGSLSLYEAQVLWDCWFVRVEREENLFVLELKLGRTSTTNFKYPFVAYFSSSSCLLHHRVFVGGATAVLANASIVRLEGAHLNVRLRDFPVFLVLLGELKLPSHNEKHQVFMICVGKKPHSLHKVGIAWLPGLEDACSDIPPSKCNVGGFGDYMGRFVFNRTH